MKTLFFGHLSLAAGNFHGASPPGCFGRSMAKMCLSSLTI